MRRQICSVQILVDRAPTLCFSENLSRRRRVELGFVNKAYLVLSLPSETPGHRHFNPNQRS